MSSSVHKVLSQENLVDERKITTFLKNLTNMCQNVAFKINRQCRQSEIILKKITRTVLLFSFFLEIHILKHYIGMFYYYLFNVLQLFIQATVVPHQIQVELVKRMSCEESAVFFFTSCIYPPC